MRVPRIYLPGPLPQQGSFVVPNEKAHYLLKVMRLKNGRSFSAFNGTGLEITAVLKTTSKEITAEISCFSYPEVEVPYNIRVFLSLAKGERFDWAVEKLTELGVGEIIPLITEFGQIKDPSTHKQERWNNLAQAAACQSGRVKVPLISPYTSFKEALDSCDEKTLKYFFAPAAEKSLNNPDKRDIALFIGPEGGFSPNEEKMAQDQGCIFLGLGPRTLRVETAAVFALARCL